MPPIHLTPTDADIIAKLCREVERLRNRLDSTKQQTADGLWIIRGVGLQPNPSASFREVNVLAELDINLRVETGDVNLRSNTRDVNLSGDRVVNIDKLAPEAHPASSVGSISDVQVLYDGTGAVLGYGPIYDTFS